METTIEYKVLKFIRQEIEANGFAPSLREIGEANNFSHTAARKALLVLERKGFVQRRPDKSRAIKVLRMPTKAEIAA